MEDSRRAETQSSSRIAANEMHAIHAIFRAIGSIFRDSKLESTL